MQAEGEPLGVAANANVENPGRENPLVETEEDRTKAQMKKTQEDLDKEKAAELEAIKNTADDDEDTDGDEPFFGNEDKKELNEIPGTFDKTRQGQVIVRQQREVFVEGAGMQLVKHPIPIQTYNEQVFNKFITKNADGMNQFKQLGIIPTVLHDMRSAKSKKNFTF